jgi:hypothetical protein
MANYAVTYQDLKTVVISLDLSSFNSQKMGLDDFDESPLAESVSLNLLARYLISYQTLQQSYFTLKWNRRSYAATCEDRGESLARVGAKPAPDIRTGFDFVLKGYASLQYYDFTLDEQHLRYFAEALNELQNAGIRVYVLISPMHAAHVEVLREMDILPLYYNWKRSLVDIVATVNSLNTDAAAVELWDFSGYNRITTEHVPEPEESATMQWYRDSAHYKQAVGDMLMNEMFGLAAPELGVLITPDTIEAHIAAEDLASAVYRAENPAEIARLQEMLLYAPYPMLQWF